MSSSIPNRVVPPPPTIQLVEELEYEVEVILVHSNIIHNKTLYYLVDWLGDTLDD